MSADQANAPERSPTRLLDRSLDGIRSLLAEIGEDPLADHPEAVVRLIDRSLPWLLEIASLYLPLRDYLHDNAPNGTLGYSTLQVAQQLVAACERAEHAAVTASLAASYPTEASEPKPPAEPSR